MGFAPKYKNLRAMHPSHYIPLKRGRLSISAHGVGFTSIWGLKLAGSKHKKAENGRASSSSWMRIPNRLK